MTDEERLARELCDALSAHLRGEVTVDGAGVHWSVKGARGGRSCRVSCFWYGPFVGAVMAMGMNPGNQRSAVSVPRRMREGGEYSVSLHDGSRRVGDGRTQSLAEAVACVRAWLDGVALDTLYEQLPFVDAKLRRMRVLAGAIRRRVGERARTAIDGTELWTYGVGRSCRIELSDDGVGCSLWMGHTQVGLAFPLDDVGELVASWVVERTPLGELQRTVPNLRVERHAEILESGHPAQWHWLHVRDRMMNDGDVVAPLRPLLELLIDRGPATEFYSFTSLNRFCFSASSHYPWVNEGLPFVVRASVAEEYVIIPEGYAFDALDGPAADERSEALSASRCSREEAAERIEAALAQSHVRPFFGSATNIAVANLADELKRRASPLSAELVQIGQWFRARVSNERRACNVSEDLRGLTLLEDGETVAYASFAGVDATIAALHAWLLERCDLAGMEGSPQIRHFGTPKYD